MNSIFVWGKYWAGDNVSSFHTALGLGEMLVAMQMNFHVRFVKSLFVY